MSPSRKRAAVLELGDQFKASERRACRVLSQPRSSQRRKAKPRDDEAMLTRRMRELVRERPRFGYRRIAALLRREGWRANPKRIYRLWRQEGLKVPRKKRKRRRLGVSENACHGRRAERPDLVWTWDFVFDRTTSGSALKWLSIVDEFTRERLCLKVARSITSEDVIDALAERFAMRGVPRHIRSDNGPEFVALAIQRRLGQVGVETLYIAPGSPWENGCAESFHSRLRDEFLALEEFENVAAARKLTAAWKDDYNHCRPHSSLGYFDPDRVRGPPPCFRCEVGFGYASAIAADWRWDKSNFNLMIGSIPGGRSRFTLRVTAYCAHSTDGPTGAWNRRALLGMREVAQEGVSLHSMSVRPGSRSAILRKGVYHDELAHFGNERSQWHEFGKANGSCKAQQNNQL